MSLFGMFLASSLTSMVMSADHPGLTFSLSLIRSEPTYNQPVQQWSFVSDFAVKPQPSLSLLLSRLVSWDVGGTAPSLPVSRFETILERTR